MLGLKLNHVSKRGHMYVACMYVVIATDNGYSPTQYQAVI